MAPNDPVIGDGALVGKVTTVDSTVSIVTLITDHTFAVVAEVLPGGYQGMLEPAVGNPNGLLLQDLPSNAPIQSGDQVVTAGFTDPSNPAAQLSVSGRGYRSARSRMRTRTSCSTTSR